MVLFALSPSEVKTEFAVGKNSYRYGDYGRVVAILTPLVEPEVLIANPEHLVEAYRLLGLSHSYLGQTADARRYFERLIRMRPTHTLSPALVPPDQIRLFEAVRASLADELEAERLAFLARQREEEERRRLQASQQIVVEKRRNSRLVAAVPFGVGQFQNDQPVAGALFLGAEVLAVSLSIGFFAAVEDLRLDNGRFAREDVSRAESMQSAQLISGGTALLLMGVGIVHALATFEEELDVQRTTVQPTANGFVWRF